MWDSVNKHCLNMYKIFVCVLQSLSLTTEFCFASACARTFLLRQLAGTYSCGDVDGGSGGLPWCCAALISLRRWCYCSPVNAAVLSIHVTSRQRATNHTTLSIVIPSGLVKRLKLVARRRPGRNSSALEKNPSSHSVLSLDFNGKQLVHLEITAQVTEHIFTATKHCTIFTVHLTLLSGGGIAIGGHFDVRVARKKTCCCVPPTAPEG